eukprot:2305149-Amphidinium_carterae.1
MAWNDPQSVEALKNSLQVMKSLGLTIVPSVAPRRPEGRRPAQTPVSPGSKKWSAQQGIGWHCPSCKYYNFGF